MLSRVKENNSYGKLIASCRRVWKAGHPSRGPQSEHTEQPALTDQTSWGTHTAADYSQYFQTLAFDFLGKQVPRLTRSKSGVSQSVGGGKCHVALTCIERKNQSCIYSPIIADLHGWALNYSQESHSKVLQSLEGMDGIKALNWQSPKEHWWLIHGLDKVLFQIWHKSAHYDLF